MKPLNKWYSLSVSEVLDSLHTTAIGLPSAEAARRLLKNGPNELQAAQHISPWSILFAQFKDILILILLVAVGLSVLRKG